MNDDAVRDVKYATGDARALCEALNLVAGKGSFSRQANGYLIRCPVHDEKTPSCSVQTRRGMVLWKCHGCGQGGDALSLIAAVHGLTMRGDDFRQVLILGAELGGLHGLVQELETGVEPTERPKPVPRPAPEPERDYPPQAEVDALWDAARLPSSDAEVSAMVVDRGLKPNDVDGAEVARALLPVGTLPWWASRKGDSDRRVSWAESGHRLILPVYDANGVMRSVRAWRVIPGDSPKRLPPAGYRASAVVLACPLAVSMLRGTWRPSRVLVLEGEPDFLTWATAKGIASHARIGMMSGSWTPEIADRIPDGADVVIRTHLDDAGRKYASEVESSLAARCNVRKLTSEAA